MNAVAYLRVSTEDQHLGPEAQAATIAAWATREGVTVAHWCSDEGVSGSAGVDARPTLPFPFSFRSGVPPFSVDLLR